MQERHNTRAAAVSKIPRAAALYRAECLEALDELEYDCPADWHARRSWPSVLLLRAVLAHLVRYVSADGYTRAVRERIACKLRVDERSISRAVEALEALGYIEQAHTIGWRALSFRLRVLEAASGKPAETEVVRLRRDLHAAKAALAAVPPPPESGVLEAQAAAELLAGADVVPLAQRADVDDAKPTPATGQLATLWTLVRDGQLDRRHVDERAMCAAECPCWTAPDEEAQQGRYGGVTGGRYKIRTCDFIRVKDAVTGLPSTKELPEAAQVVLGRVLEHRQRVHQLEPGSPSSPARAPAAWLRQHLAPWVDDCEALQASQRCDYGRAVEALLTVAFKHRGFKDDSGQDWHDHKHRLDWYPKHRRLLLEQAELLLRASAKREHHPARKSSPGEDNAPPKCGGVCNGGAFPNIHCDECTRRKDEAEAAKRTAAERAEREHADELAQRRAVQRRALMEVG